MDEFIEGLSEEKIRGIAKRQGYTFNKLELIMPRKDSFIYSFMDFTYDDTLLLNIPRCGSFANSSLIKRLIFCKRDDAHLNAGIGGEQRLGVFIYIPKRDQQVNCGSYNIKFIKRAYHVHDFKKIN